MNEHVDMAAWGLTEPFQTAAADFPGLTVGRVVSQERGAYRVICAQGERSAAVSGKYRYEAQAPADYPAVGDIVILDTAPDPAVIHALLPRKSVFIRKAAGTGRSEQVVAANVDTVFLCMALNADFNLRRMERFLSIAWESGATPVVLLTKADLCDDVEGHVAAVSEIAIGADVLVTSSLEKDGCDAVLAYLAKGRTVALIGSSGIGKSTLINRLLGEERIRTGGLRNDEKGRHTTTHRELLLLPMGGVVMDTPGMRELGMWDAAEGLEKTFADIEALAQTCRFADCKHQGEPGCAVRAAIQSGALPQERWLSYQKLQTENAYMANSANYLAAKEQKFMGISKQNKMNRKTEQRRS